MEVEDIMQFVLEILALDELIRGVGHRLEAYVAAHWLKLILVLWLAHTVILFCWHASQLLKGQLQRVNSIQRVKSMSPYWQIAALALLTANVHLQMVIAH